MKIHGLQKMTLLDYPGKVACTVFLAGCDFRCPFCHNSELITGDAEVIMEDKELLDFLKKRQGILEGVAITGGEPLLRKDIKELLVAIKELGYPVKLDTNGNHPEILKELVNDGLVSYVAMDVKNSKEKYAQTIGLDKFDITNVDESINFLLNSNIDYEFRTTVLKELHDESSFEGIAKWIQGAKNYFIQNFVDRDTVVFDGLHGFEENELKKFSDIVSPYVKNIGIR